MEREAMRDEPEPMRVLEHTRGHLRRAAEFARQRPFGARAVAQDAAEHFRARRGARDLLDLRLAIDREQPHAEREGARDVALLLDRVAEADAVRRRARRERLLDLDDEAAQSKQEPSRASRSRISGAGLAFTA